MGAFLRLARHRWGMFPAIPYLDWIEGRQREATHDLGSSDLRTHDPWSTVVPDPLEGRADPPDPPRIQESIAHEYDVPEECVLVAAGATHANFLAAATALALADADRAGVGDDVGHTSRVLVEEPGYDPLIYTPKGFGAAVDRFDRPAGEGYPIRADCIRDAASDDTVLVTVSNRHNPSGRLETRDTLANAAAAAGDAGATLLVDEVYGPFVTDGDAGLGFGGVTGAGLPDTVVTGSLTKFHGLGGLRLGWLIGPEPFVERARTVRSHVPAVASPSVGLAIRFFYHRDDLVATQRRHLRRNHELLADFVAGRDDLTGPIHDDCSFGFVAHDRADGDEVARAAHEAGVLVVPGRFFDDPSRFRLSAGRDTDAVREGLAVLGDVLDGL